MTDNLLINHNVLEELDQLVAASLVGNMLPNEAARLEKLVGQDIETCDLYLNVISESSILLTWAIHGGLKSEEENEVRADHLRGDQQSTAPAQTTNTPILTFLSPPLRGMSGYFFSDWSVAYLIATVICGIGALIGAFTYVTHPVQVDRDLPTIAKEYPAPVPQMEFVGRITGMVDCQWADESTAAFNGAHVPLGRKYALASGLMEITYDTRAKVILQGPVTYEVESKDGGYLSLGKLTARVNRAKPQAANPSSALRLPPSALFSVRTPTATVTDLGTEFGVEVDKHGETTSHVFRGSVRVQAVSPDGKVDNAGQVLQDNESVKVRSNQSVIILQSDKPTDYVRQLPDLSSKTFDLVDVLAGGDGSSGKRARGIDPSNGRITDGRPPTDKFFLESDGKYHRVMELPFIDGVFIPAKESAQVDSAGHTFADWRNVVMDTTFNTYGDIWAGGKVPADTNTTIPTQLGDIDYAATGHGLIFLHANSGITFDLAAIRLANPGQKLARFLAMTGNSESGYSGSADVWVLIDGQVRFRRREINGFNGAFSVAIPIAESNRFLTLASTDGGNGIGYDWIIFGDPRLELTRVPASTGPRSPNHDSPDNETQPNNGKEATDLIR